MFRGRSEGFVVRASIKRGKVPGIDDSEVFSVDIKVQAPSAAITLDLKKPTPSIDIGPQPQKATPATPSKMPSITCSRCSRVGIERELHYSCDICNGGKWSLCLKCYRAGNGCLHWFGFGQRAWVKWEQARENDPTLSRPHILSPSRFVPLEEPISGGQSTYDRDFRREQGAFCARCFASANECYWQCNMCNDGAWGYCNNCVNQGYICTHALLPLKAKASQLTMAEPSTLLHPWEPTTECERCLGPIPMKKKRYHCPECTSIRHPSAGPGNYDMCIACYDGSSIAKEISDENRSAGLRRCLAGHRMQLISFVESSTGLRRAISHDIVGGRSLRITPYEGKEFAGLELERWRWKFETANTQWVDRLVTKNVSESAPLMAYLHPHSDGTSQWTTMFPPDIYRSQRAIAMWSWYPQDQADELLFPKGAEICEIQDVNGEWFWGAYMGTTGLFPASYVRSLDEDY
ncbi:hypothetical protein GQ53DRAFT_714229 [Thozetella sp. PMI_491]|nr:hypothetical protein GQ53DRAFT_714229 [Thozetella sp. PMI_491]